MLKIKKDKLPKRVTVRTLCDTLEPHGAPTESTSKPAQYGPRKVESK